MARDNRQLSKHTQVQGVGFDMPIPTVSSVFSKKLRSKNLPMGTSTSDMSICSGENRSRFNVEEAARS